MNQSYDLLGPDGLKIGEVIKRQYYGLDGYPSHGVLTEVGLVGDDDKIVATWDGDTLVRADAMATFTLRAKG